MFAAACNSKVDLPMPGSPPISTSDPGTTPPPSTRSNSSMPVERRAETSVSMSSYSRGPAVAASEYREVALAAPAPAPADAGTARSSTIESHAPHSMQRPVHFAVCAPHCWQLNTTFCFIPCLAVPPIHRRPGEQETPLISCKVFRRLPRTVLPLDSGPDTAE